MMPNRFPDAFPTNDEMFTVLQKTIEKSWMMQNELDLNHINRWLNNFSGEFLPKESERKLALWLLCNFTFFNKNEVDHLLGYLYRKLANRIRARHTYTEDEVNDIMRHTYFVPIGVQSESGSMLSYFLRQSAAISTEHFKDTISDVPLNAKLIVFVDDFFGSGDTVVKFTRKIAEQLEQYCHVEKEFLSVFATESALHYLKNEHGIDVTYASCIDERCKAFSEHSLCFAKFPTLREPTMKMAEYYGNKLRPGSSLGYGDGQLLIGFWYNVPNNSLPILWADNNGWFPFLKREEKVKHDREKQGFIADFI